MAPHTRRSKNASNTLVSPQLTPRYKCRRDPSPSSSSSNSILWLPSSSGGDDDDEGDIDSDEGDQIGDDSEDIEEEVEVERVEEVIDSADDQVVFNKGDPMHPIDLTNKPRSNRDWKENKYKDFH